MRWWRDDIDRRGVFLGTAALVVMVGFGVFYAYVGLMGSHRVAALGGCAGGIAVGLFFFHLDRLFPQLSRALEGVNWASWIGISVVVVPFAVRLLSDAAKAAAAGFGLGFLLVAGTAMGRGLLALVLQPGEVWDGMSESDVARVQRAQRRVGRLPATRTSSARSTATRVTEVP